MQHFCVPETISRSDKSTEKLPQMSARKKEQLNLLIVSNKHFEVTAHLPWKKMSNFNSFDTANIQGQ